MSEQQADRAPGAKVHVRAIPPWVALVAAVVIYVCFFSHLGALGLVGPDEPRYAAVAREMAESGDWLTPRLNGQPWFEKPPLYYWAAALTFRTFGVSEFSARLPSALAAALATLALAWAAWHLYGAPTACSLLLILPACVGAFSFARAATTDMLFSAALTAALVAGCAMIWSPRGRESAKRHGTALARMAFGVLLGAATLAKGPAAIILAAGSAGLWAVATRRWRGALRLAHPLALASFCVVTLPWYLLCAARNPDFMRTFLFAHNIERYLTPVFRHQQPFWFFGPVLLLGLLPWTALLVGVARDALRATGEKDWPDSPGLFLACWSVFPVVFFSFSKSKLPGYVLPALPPLALLLARNAARVIREKESLARWLFAGIGGTFVALAATAGHWLKRLPPGTGLAAPNRVLPWLAVVIAGGLAIAIVALLNKPEAALLAAALLMAGLVEAANRRALPRLDTYVSSRPAARAAQGLQVDAQNISVYRLHRAWHYGLNFYLHRELPQWTPQSPRPGWLYTNAGGLGELERQGARVTVLERSSPEAWLVRVEP